MVYVEDVEASSSRKDANVLRVVANSLTEYILSSFDLLGQSAFLDWALWEIRNPHLLLEVKFVAKR